MKAPQIFLFALLGCVSAWAQTNTFPASGDVGIGTSSPGAKLEVNNGDIHVNKTTSTGAYKIRFRGYSTSFGYDSDGSEIGRDGAFIATQDASKHFFIAPAGTIQYAFRSSGNLGIGIENPSARLHVIGQDVRFFSNTSQNNLEIGRDNIQKFVFTVTDNNAFIDLQQDSDGNSHHIMYFRNKAQGTSPDNDIRFQTSGTDRLTIKDNGDIGIGTSSPDDKLTVKGRIHAEEVKVDLSVPGPDYVFKEGYELKSLEEVQHYVEENGHLPNIPSAFEMEENGVELGLMNMKLLEKIEELTLYMIDMNKRMELLEKENQGLKKELANSK